MLDINYIKEFSPIVILGDKGTGKTTFLRELYKSRPEFIELQKYFKKHSGYGLGHLICNQEITMQGAKEIYDAIAKKKYKNIRKSLLNKDIVMIDDFDCIAGKFEFQNEFCKLLSTVLYAKIPIVIATSKQITAENGFNEKLVTFFEKGKYITVTECINDI